MTQTLEAPPAALPRNTPPPAACGPFSVIFNRDPLAAALAALAPCVKARGPIACLSCVKLTAADGSVTLEATDRELWASRTVTQVQVEAAGALLVSYDALRRAVGKLAGQTIRVAIDGGVVRVFDEDFGYDLEPSALAEFPPALKSDAARAGTILAAGLARLVKQTDAARDDSVSTRYVFQAFYLSASGERVRCVACDGKHLHDAGARWEPASKKSKLSAVIPAAALKAVVVMAGEEGDVGIAVGDEGEAGRIAFSGDGWQLSGPLVAGNYPSPDDVIPQSNANTATVAREDLLRLFGQAAELLDHESRWLKAEWDLTGLTLSPARNVSRGGKSLRALPLKYQGAPLTIGLNAPQIIAALTAADSTEVTVGLDAPNRPIRIDAGPDFKAVVMPISLVGT